MRRETYLWAAKGTTKSTTCKASATGFVARVAGTKLPARRSFPLLRVAAVVLSTIA